MTAEQMLKRLIQEIDANSVRNGKDGDKVLAAIDVALLDQAWQVANKDKPG